jgi:parvulin-like peptidyl-prolyl isomerase
MLIEQTITRVVEDRVHVGEDEVEGYYWTNLLEFYRPVRVHARQIVVETEAQAKTLKKQLDEGENFQALARQYSRGPEKDQGGDLGWVGADDLPQAFTTNYGYHIFTVDKRERGGRISLDEAKKEIKEKIKLNKTDQVFQSWLGEIRAQANIAFKNQ